MASAEFIAHIQLLILTFIPILFALSAHEASHAWVAKKCGDNTTFHLGRISLNPFMHIDWIGTCIIPIMSYLTFSQPFGWTKAVPINPYRLSSRTMILTAAAGPISNLILAILAIPILKILNMTSAWFADSVAEHLFYLLNTHIEFNVLFFLINLLPIFPLDGSKIAFCPYHVERSKWLQLYSDTGPYLLLMLMSTGFVFVLIQKPWQMICNFLYVCAL